MSRKTSETQEFFRKRKPLRMKGTQKLFAFLLISFAAVISVASWGFSLLTDSTLPSVIVVLIVSLTLSAGAMFLLRQIFLKPMDRLADSMDKVARGDFSVRIGEKSSLSEMNRLYDNFNTMTKELSSTEILQSDFTANVSHEFKTPINAIEGYATLLQGYSDLPGDMREYVDKIVFNTDRLSRLVGNILLLNKVDNRTITGTSAFFRVDEQIRMALMEYEDAWEKKELDLDVDLDEAEFFGSESLMMHVWTNLISNAVKFSPQGGTLRMRLYSGARRLVFTIDDDGESLSEATMLHMFDKFYQGDTSHKAEGNGLGLALAQRILKSCGGTVGAENLPDGGCRFTVTLPQS